MTDAKNDIKDWDDPEADTYLVFTLSDGLYATPLLAVREVVEYKTPKPLPNTRPSFLGVINVRGEIVGIVDLAMKLGGKATKVQRPTLLVIGTEEGALAAVVDEVVSVVRIEASAIDRQSHGENIARLDERLVTLLDLKRVVSASEISNIKKAAA